MFGELYSLYDMYDYTILVYPLVMTNIAMEAMADLDDCPFIKAPFKGFSMVISEISGRRCPFPIGWLINRGKLPFHNG